MWDLDGATTLQGTWGCYGGENPMLEVTPVGTVRLTETIEASVAAPSGDRTFTLTEVALP